MKTIIISDLHLGSPLSRADDLRKMLAVELPDVLIINGDIFAAGNVDRFTEAEFALLQYLRSMRLVVPIRGNHDFNMDKALSGLLGVASYEEYRFNLANLRCLVIHGHQFDGFITKFKGLSRFISFIYRELQRVPFIRQHIAELAERTASNWQRLTPLVRDRAVEYAKAHDIDIIFCGHTHHMCWTSTAWASYYNSGCWVGNSRNYLVLSDEGISLEDYEGRPA